MGVEGLHEFINENAKEAVVNHKLEGCRVIIDGKNLMFHLHSKCSRQTVAFGGDYDAFATEIDMFFNNLLACNIEPCVLIDGGVSMKLSSVKWGVHLLKSGIKACAQTMPGQSLPLKVHPPLLREVFISRVRSQGITVLQSDSSADDDIVTLASTFQLPVLSGDSDFCVHGLAVINFNHLVYSKPVPLENDPSRFYIRCRVFDKHKFCELMGINSDHIMLLATLGMQQSLKRFNLVQFINRISKGVKRDRSKPWFVHKMTVVRQWLSQRKDKSTVQIVEEVLDMLPKYREMRYTLRTLLYRLLMVSPSASPLLPWFANGPDDWPCGHSAFTSRCVAHAENLTTPDLIDKIKAKKEQYAARQVVHYSFLSELKRQDADCPHAVTHLTFAGGLPLPRWFVLSQRLCLLDFGAGEIFAKKTLFSMPLMETVTHTSASLVSLPIIKVLLAISEKTFFEYEKNYLLEQLKSLQETPGEESAQLAETIRGNLKECKLNYFTFKKHLWNLRRNCSKGTAVGKVASAGNFVSPSSLPESNRNQATESNEVVTEKLPPCKDLSSSNEMNEIERLESYFEKLVIENGSNVPTEESISETAMSEISKTCDTPKPSLNSSPASEEENHSSIVSSVSSSPKTADIDMESLTCSSNIAHPYSPCSSELTLEANGKVLNDGSSLCDDADLLLTTALEVEENDDSDASFHSCLNEENHAADMHQITSGESCAPSDTQEITEDPLSCSEIVEDFHFSYFQNNLANVPVSDLVESDYSDLDESNFTSIQKEEFSVATSESNRESPLPIKNADVINSDSDDDVLIEDDDDPTILYKPSHLDIQSSYSTNEFPVQGSTSKEHENMGNGFHAQKADSVEINSSLKNSHSLKTTLPNAIQPQSAADANYEAIRSFSFTSTYRKEDSAHKNSTKKDHEPVITDVNASISRERNLISEPEFRIEYNQKGEYEIKLLKSFSTSTEITLRNQFEVTLKVYRKDIEKVRLYEKENKLTDGYRGKMLERMNSFLQERMLPVLEKESNTNLAVELVKPLDGDFEKSLLYTRHSVSQILPYAMRPLTFFVRKPSMQTVQVVHVQSDRSLQVPSLLTLHTKSVVERKELLCDFVKLEFKKFKRLPTEVQIVVLSICFWYQNCQRNVNHYHVYAILVSFIMFFFIDQKIGKTRWDEKLKKIVDLESKAEDSNSKLFANARDKLKNICYIASHLDGHSCAVAALGLVQYHQPCPSLNHKTFQRHFVHALSEFQCCYSSIGSLNSFLGSPFMMPSIDRVLNCTFAYNVFCDLSSCKDPGVSLAERLGPRKQMIYLMDALHSCVSDIVLMPKVLDLFPKELKVETNGKKVSKLVSDVKMENKLRKEQLRIEKINELAKIDAIVKDIENIDLKKSNNTTSKETSKNNQVGKSASKPINKQTKR